MINISFTMEFVVQFLLSATLSVGLAMLALGLKERLENAKWKKEHRTLWLRHYYETHPNQIMLCSDVIAMAKEGLQEVVFVEWSNDYDDYARPRLTENGDIYFELLGEGKSAVFKAEDYSKAFRCWLHRPTDEEIRKAPKWKGERSNG